MVGTDALFGKTEDLFDKTDIWFEVTNIYLFFYKVLNRYSYRPNRGLIGSKILDKTGILILSRRENYDLGKKYLFETHPSLAASPLTLRKGYTLLPPSITGFTVIIANLQQFPKVSKTF